jgi:hypothetical protein
MYPRNELRLLYGTVRGESVTVFIFLFLMQDSRVLYSQAVIVEKLNYIPELEDIAVDSELAATAESL